MCALVAGLNGVNRCLALENNHDYSNLLLAVLRALQCDILHQANVISCPLITENTTWLTETSKK